MSNVATMPPRVNGILETSLYVESPARSAEFYRRVFGFEPLEPGEPLNDETRLCPMRAGDRSVLLLFKKGATAGTDANGAIHIAFGIARCDLPVGERWLKQQGISIELRKTWKYGGEVPRSRRSSAGGCDAGSMEHLLTASYPHGITSTVRIGRQIPQ